MRGRCPELDEVPAVPAATDAYEDRRGIIPDVGFEYDRCGAPGEPSLVISRLPLLRGQVTDPPIFLFSLGFPYELHYP